VKVVVFGASGKVGRVVVETLLERGHGVRVFIHKTSRFEDDERVKTIKGDIHRLEDVRRAVQDVNAVISVVSSWKAKDKDVLSSGVENILQTVDESDGIRIVSLTGNLARGKDERWPLAFRLARSAMLIFAKGVIKDAELHIERLVSSNQDWVVVRSPVITSSKNCRGYKFSEEQKFVATKSVKCVASGLVDLAENKNSSLTRKLLFIY
jgi:hypothetical protein